MQIQLEPKNTGEPRGLKVKVRSFFAQEFFHNPIVQWISIGSLFCNIAGWVMLVIFVRPIDLPIVLHYNVYFGVDLIGDWWQVYFLPGIGLLFLVINLAMAHMFWKQGERIASYLFLMASLVVQAGVIIAGASAIVMNY